MRYVTIDDQEYEADTPEELVSQLAEGSIVPVKDDAAFMQVSAKRALMQTGDTVRCDTANHFVQDMIAAGLLRLKQKEGADK